MSNRDLLLLVCALTSGAGACDMTGAQDGPDGGPDGPGVTVSGLAINHSMNRRAGTPPELSRLTLAVVDPATLTDAAGPSLAAGPLPTDSCEASGGCPWSLDVSDLASVGPGLAARITDDRATDEWITTLTGFATAAELAAAGADGEITSGRAFAVSRAALDTVVAPMLGLSGDEVLARGVVFGLVYGGRAADGRGAPVVGATVTPSDADLRVVYPNSMFSGTGSATGNQGAFLAVPSRTGLVTTTTFTVNAPAGHLATWDATQPARVVPGAMYFTLMFAE